MNAKNSHYEKLNYCRQMFSHVDRVRACVRMRWVSVIVFSLSLYVLFLYAIPLSFEMLKIFLLYSIIKLEAETESVFISLSAFLPFSNSQPAIHLYSILYSSYWKIVCVSVSVHVFLFSSNIFSVLICSSNGHNILPRFLALFLSFSFLIIVFSFYFVHTFLFVCC